MNWKRIALILAASSTAACATQDPPPPGSTEENRVLIFAAGSLPALSVSLPHGFQVTQLQGIDSQVARITGPGMLMNVDYGQGGGNQECGPLPDCRGSQATVDNRVATWIRQRKTVQVDGQTFLERMHVFIPVRSGNLQRAGPQAGVRFSAVCKPDCNEAERIALSARLQ